MPPRRPGTGVVRHHLSTEFTQMSHRSLAQRSILSMSAEDAFTPLTSNAHQSTASTSTQPTVTSSLSKRKADQTLYSDAKRRKLEDNAIKDGAAKSDTTKAESKMLEQITRYARDVLQSSIARIHVVNMTVNGWFSSLCNNSLLKGLYRRHYPSLVV